MGVGPFEETGIVPVEVGEDPVEGQVVETAVVAEVLHVASSGGVEGMHERIVGAVEVEDADPEALAQFDVEGGAQLEPPAVEQDLGVSVPHEDVSAHGGLEPLGGEVIPNVGEPESGGNALRSGGRAEQDALGHAPVRLAAGDVARPVLPG